MKKHFLGYLMVMATSLSSHQALAEDATALKLQIVELAQSFDGQADLDGSKTQALQKLIDQLLAVTPAQTMAEKAAVAVGAWHQIWGPYSYNGGSTQNINPDNIYQVISAQGYYTNIGIYNFLGFNFTGVLKGQYTVTADQVNVKFVESGILFGDLPDGASLADLPALKAAGKVTVIDFPSFVPPVGFTGGLQELYDDADLRITYGVQEGVPGKALYVLERVPALSY